MVFRPLAIAIAACLGTGLALAQAGNSVLNPGKPSVPAVGQPDKADDTPQITPELRGDIFMAKKQSREAIDAFHQGSTKDPVLWNKTGIAYHQMLQLDSALKCYQEAVRLRKTYLEAINNIGTVYYARKNYRRSITYYQRALKFAPQEARSGSIYSNLG